MWCSNNDDLKCFQVCGEFPVCTNFRLLMKSKVGVRLVHGYVRIPLILDSKVGVCCVLHQRTCERVHVLCLNFGESYTWVCLILDWLRYILASWQAFDWEIVNFSFKKFQLKRGIRSKPQTQLRSLLSWSKPIAKINGLSDLLTSPAAVSINHSWLMKWSDMWSTAHRSGSGLLYRTRLTSWEASRWYPAARSRTSGFAESFTQETYWVYEQASRYSDNMMS